MADKAGLSKKVGPLPLWVWGALGGVVVYFLYERYKAGQTSSSTTGTNSALSGVLDPNALDPNTGLTYGEEESAALNANAAAGPLNGTSASEGALASQGTLQTGTNELGDLSTFLSGFQTVAGQLGYTAPGQGIPAVPSTNASTTSTNAASSPPVVNNYFTTPATVPQVNINRAASHGATSATSATALGTLTQLLNEGYKKVAGTTQKAAQAGIPLPQTGTYKKKGQPTYFVYGSSKTGYQIRKA